MGNPWPEFRPVRDHRYHHAALASGDEVVANPLEFMNPFGAGRVLVHQDRLTGTDETRRLAPVAGTDGTPSHTGVMADEIASG